MSQSPEEFDSLRRLLSLKRFESPPPGYFDQLSSRIRTRVLSEVESAAQQPWWRRMFGLPLLNGILANPNAFTVAGLALVGISLALVLNSDNPAAPQLGGLAPAGPSFRPTTAGIADPVSFSVGSNWTSVSDSVSGVTIRLIPVEGVSNQEGPPASLFAVPALQHLLRVDYTLDPR